MRCLTLQVQMMTARSLTNTAASTHTSVITKSINVDVDGENCRTFLSRSAEHAKFTNASLSSLVPTDCQDRGANPKSTGAGVL